MRSSGPLLAVTGVAPHRLITEDSSAPGAGRTPIMLGAGLTASESSTVLTIRKGGDVDSSASRLRDSMPWD